MQGFKFRAENAKLKKQIRDKAATIESINLYRKQFEELQAKTKTQQDLESRKNGVKYDYKVFAINMNRDKRLYGIPLNQYVDRYIIYNSAE